MSNYNVAFSGLDNVSHAIDTVSNNIANANTVGYKAGQWVFADQFMKASSSTDVARAGMGAQNLSVRRPMIQGTLTTSANPLDLAISGKGMFRLLSPAGISSDQGKSRVDPSALYYTRNGQFSVNKEGYIVNENGMYLTGYQTALDGTLTDDIYGRGKQAGRIMMPEANLVGNKTTQSSLSAILDSTEAPFTKLGGIPFDPDKNTFNHKTTQTIFDDEGNPHTLEVYYRRVDDVVNMEITPTPDPVSGKNLYTYAPSKAHYVNTTSNAEQVVLSAQTSVRVDTAPELKGTIAQSSDSEALDPTIIYTKLTGVPKDGWRIYLNGVDTGATVVDDDNNSGTQFKASHALDVKESQNISFYPNNKLLDMTATLTDGTEITVQGYTNNPNPVVGNPDLRPLTTTCAHVEVYAAVDGKPFNESTSTYSNPSIDPSDYGVPGDYMAVAELKFIGGKNIDSLAKDPQTGNPIFKTQTKLTTLFQNAAGGLSHLVFDLDLTDTSLAASAFQMTKSVQNGEPMAKLSDITIDNQGRIAGVYGNGKVRYAGQIALVHFDAFEQMSPVGKNAFAATVESGTEDSAEGVLVGHPGTGEFGEIKSQALESSNVDLSSELVRLMILQRTYSANSQSMKAVDQVMRDTLQMIS